MLLKRSSLLKASKDLTSLLRAKNISPIPGSNLIVVVGFHLD